MNAAATQDLCARRSSPPLARSAGARHRRRKCTRRRLLLQLLQRRGKNGRPLVSTSNLDGKVDARRAAAINGRVVAEARRRGARAAARPADRRPQAARDDQRRPPGTRAAARLRRRLVLVRRQGPAHVCSASPVKSPYSTAYCGKGDVAACAAPLCGSRSTRQERARPPRAREPTRPLGAPTP